MSRSSSSRYQQKDRFFHKAKQDQFVARSVYKLQELNRRYALIGKNQVVVDLGCAPGSWLQYIASEIGRKGLVVGYDLVPVEISAGSRARAFTCSVDTLTSERIREDLRQLQLDLKPDREPSDPVIDALVSDMAPKLTGIRDADQAKSVELVLQALTLAQSLLRPHNGVFVAKFFQGRDSDELVASVKKVFAEVKLLKPEATREGSREVFVLGRRLRPIP